MNPAICDLLGRSEAELLTMNFLDVTHPDDASTERRPGRATSSPGAASSLRVTKRYVTGKRPGDLGRRDGLGRAQSDGTVRHRIAQILDVTAEHALRASLMEAERIAHLGGWQLDVATGAVVWSPELYALFGLDPTGPAPDYPEQRQLFTPESWQRLSAAVAETRADR